MLQYMLPRWPAYGWWGGYRLKSSFLRAFDQSWWLSGIFIQILFAVEKEFKMEIPNNVLNDINTMGDVMRLVEQPPLQRRELFPSVNFDDLPPNLYIQR